MPPTEVDSHQGRPADSSEEARTFSRLLDSSSISSSSSSEEADVVDLEELVFVVVEEVEVEDAL